MNITELCNKYGSDKGTINNTNDPNTWMHSYSIFYDQIMGHLKDKQLNILDIGAWGANDGGSTKTWQEFFVKSNIYACDINPKVVELNKIDRVKAFELDLDKEFNVLETISKLKVTFDIVIEDALHSEQQQCRTLINLCPFMSSGSTYIIEDAPHSMNLINAINNQTGFPYLSAFENIILINKIVTASVIKTNNVSTLIYIRFR